MARIPWPGFHGWASMATLSAETVLDSTHPDSTHSDSTHSSCWDKKTTGTL